MRSAASNTHPSSTSGDPTHASVVVELCGLPGSGKSHLADELLRTLASRGIRARAGTAGVAPGVAGPRRVARKVAAAADQGLERPATSLRAALRIATATRSPSDAASRSLQWLVTQHLLSRAHGRPGVAVFDEGLLQALWSIGSRGDVGRLLGSLDAAMGPGPPHGDAHWIGPDIVVAVEVPSGVALERLERRGSHHSRIERLPLHARAAELRRGEALLERLLDWWSLAADPGGEVVRIRNDDQGLTTVGIAEIVRNLVARIRPSAEVGRGQF